MNELLVIVRQIVIMFLLMSVGFFIYKKKMIDDHSTKQLTDIVLYIHISKETGKNVTNH